MSCSKIPPKQHAGRPEHTVGPALKFLFCDYMIALASTRSLTYYTTHFLRYFKLILSPRSFPPTRQNRVANRVSRERPRHALQDSARAGDPASAPRLRLTNSHCHCDGALTRWLRRLYPANHNLRISLNSFSNQIHKI